MHPVRRLHIVTLIEGVSTLVLFFVAMPLKYFAGKPEAVKFVGWLHGILFVAVMVLLAWVMFRCRWPLGRGVLVFLSALVPFGPFVIHRRMTAYEAEAVAKE
jgi:integral membrane protein